jgi:hypothetical protein
VGDVKCEDEEVLRVNAARCAGGGARKVGGRSMMGTGRTLVVKRRSGAVDGGMATTRRAMMLARAR